MKRMNCQRRELVHILNMCGNTIYTSAFTYISVYANKEKLRSQHSYSRKLETDSAHTNLRTYSIGPGSI